MALHELSNMFLFHCLSVLMSSEGYATVLPDLYGVYTTHGLLKKDVRETHMCRGPSRILKQCPVSPGVARRTRYFSAIHNTI